MTRQRIASAIALLVASTFASDAAAQGTSPVSAPDVGSFSTVAAMRAAPMLRSDAARAVEVERTVRGRRSSAEGIRTWLFRAVNATEGAGVFAVNRAMPVQFMIIDRIDLELPAGNLADVVDPSDEDPFAGLDDIVGTDPESEVEILEPLTAEETEALLDEITGGDGDPTDDPSDDPSDEDPSDEDPFAGLDDIGGIDPEREVEILEPLTGEETEALLDEVTGGDEDPSDEDPADDPNSEADDAESAAQKLGMDPGTLEFNRSIEQVLDDQVAKIEGDRDAAGNLTYDYGTLNPFDDNPVFDERPVSRPVVQGLVLKREHVSTMFDKFATQLEGIQGLSDDERLAIARDLLSHAAELQDARVNMLANEPSPYDRYGRRVSRDADDYAAYNYRRGVYFDLLGENPLLAIYGDFTILGGDQYFHEALYHDFLNRRDRPSTAAERKEYDDDLLALFDTALEEGIANARDEADRIAGLNSFEDLLELAGPEYALADQQLRENAAVFGSDYVDNLLGTVQGEFGTIEAIDAPRELFISTMLAAGAVVSSVVIPGSGGVVLTVVFAGADVAIEGTKLWRLEGQLDREMEAGAVLGFDHLGELKDATDDQRKMAFAAALFGVVDAATLTRLGRASRGVEAADEVGEAVDAGRAVDRPVDVPEEVAEAPTVIDRVPRAEGPRTERIAGAPSSVAADVGGLTDEELAFWRARYMASEDDIQAMDALLRQARSDASDIPHQTIDEALEAIEERAARDPSYRTDEALDDLNSRLVVAEMDAEGHVLLVRNRNELAEFAEEAGGAVPRNVVEGDANAMSDLKAKAAIAANGRPVTNWTPADRALAEEVLADEDFYGHLFDWVSDESGIQRVFSDEDFTNLREVFPDLVPAAALDDAADAARAIDETPTFLDRPRRPADDAAFRDAPAERDFSVEDETPTGLNRAPRPVGLSVDEKGVATLDLLQLGWKLPGLAGEVIEVGNEAGEADDAPMIEAYVTSDGGSTGDVMSLSVLNQGKPIRLQGEGLVLEPVELSEDESAALSDRLEQLGQLGGQLVTHELTAYCMQFLADVPVAGQLFRIAPPDAQQAYAGMRSVLGASDEVRDELNPDSDPDGYFHSTRQWAIWTRERSLTAEQFEEAFLEHTRRNVEASGRQWTPDIEETVRGLVPNRWRDIQAVLERAR